MKRKRKFWFFPVQTFLEVSGNITINLTSGWLGIILISPGITGVTSPEVFLQILINNGLFAIVGLVVSLWLVQKSKEL